jgi:uncharacterized membrane protein YphA (DoxX/SURF4 family)
MKLEVQTPAGSYALPHPSQREMTSRDPGSAPPWSPAFLFSFRVAFAFFCGWCLPQLVATLPFAKVVVEPFWRAESRLGVFTIVHVLGWPSPGNRPYSDNLVPLVREVIVLIAAIAAAIIWTLVDREKREHRRLAAWLSVLVRFALAMEMVAYGLSKVFPVQFGGRIGLFALVSPLGFFTPQGLLWSFMGFSRLYTVFAGLGEFIGAILVCFRRTATFGALLLSAILANVLVMNVAYDVPVKLTAANLLILAILIAGYDWRRIVDGFFRQRATRPPDLPPLFRSPRANVIAGRFGPVLVLGLFCFNSMTDEVLPEGRENKALTEATALFGIYDVDSDSVADAVASPPEDPRGWHRIVLERYGQVLVQTRNGKGVVLSADVDSVRRVVRLTERGIVGPTPTIIDSASAKHFTFQYSMPGPGRLHLRGGAGRDSSSLNFRRVDPTRFLLMRQPRWLGWGGW